MGNVVSLASDFRRHFCFALFDETIELKCDADRTTTSLDDEYVEMQSIKNTFFLSDLKPLRLAIEFTSKWFLFETRGKPFSPTTLFHDLPPNHYPLSILRSEVK